jgi:hypothetical protein
VSPRDWNFRDFHSRFACKVEQFRVKPPTLDLLLWEYLSRSRARECFETALRVFDIEAENNSKRDVEGAPIKLTQQRLPLSLKLGTKPTGADGDIRAGMDRFEKLRGFFNGRRQVGVTKKKYLAGSIQHAVADAISFAAIARIVEKAEVRVRCGILADEIRSVIPRAVVDDDNFGIPSPRRDVVQNTIECRAQARGFVVSRNDDAVLGHQAFGRQRQAEGLDEGITAKAEQVPAAEGGVKSSDLALAGEKIEEFKDQFFIPQSGAGFVMHGDRRLFMG